MLTGEIRGQIDRIWNTFWAGGIANPLEVIEQITYLLFLKRLDELETAAELAIGRDKKSTPKRFFPEGKDSKKRSYQDYQLPTGRTYTFKWNNNSLGELQEIDLPTGGAISYTYQGGCQTNPDTTSTTQDCRMQVKTRTVTQNGTSAIWKYNLFLNLPTGTATVTDPYGNDEVHTFSDLGTGGGQTWETQVQYWNGSSASGAGGTLLKTMAKKYTVGGANSILGPNGLSARPIEEDTTLQGGAERMTQWDYETYTEWWGTATRMNVTAEREYDYGSGVPGSLLRRTAYTYKHTGNQSYINANIVDRVASVTVYDSTSNTCLGVNNPCSQTINEYDNYGHANQSMVSSGAVQHDSNFSTTYTLRGNLTAVQHWRNTDGALLTTTNQYDDAGNLISTIDPLSHKTAYDYTDAWANATCAPAGQGKAYVTTATNPLGQTTTHTYNSCTATVASTTDANLQPTSFSFDLMGRHTQTNFPDGGQTLLCYSDNASGGCYSASTPLTTTRTEKITASPVLNRTDVNVYDDLGRLEETKLTSDPDGTDYTRTSYDLLGRKSQEWNPTRCDPFANPTSCSGETSFGVTTYNYDALSRLFSQTQPDGSLINRQFNDANNVYCTTISDEVNRSHVECTDGLGRLTQLKEDQTGVNYLTLYTYDALGNLTCVEQHGSASTGTGCSSSPSNDASSPWRVRRFTYNSLSELLSSSNPESGAMSYTYDNDGNVVTKTAPAPNQTGIATVITTYTYETLNRLVQKNYNDGKTPTVEFAYDGGTLAGCPAQAPPGDADTYPVGRRTAMCDASGATNWTHDKMGRVLQERRTIGTVAGKNDTDVYNLDGSVSSITTLGYAILYTYNGAQRPIRAWNNSTTPVTNYVVTANYAPFGGLATATLGTAPITINDSYNTRLQPIFVSAAAASPILSLCYDFHSATAISSPPCSFPANSSGDNGNVFKIVNNRDNNRTRNFLYDSLNRISQAYTTGTNWGETFGPSVTAPGVQPTMPGIDAWGNLTNRSGVTGKSLTEGLSVSASLKNQLSGFGYDAAGNMTSNGSASYVYDAENRLIAAGGMSYLYDGDGKRVKKCTEGATAGSCATGATGTLYWGVAGGETSIETDLAGNVLEDYVFFNGKRVARRDASTAAIHFYFSDHLGTHSLITDANGSMPPQFESDFFPYGGEVPITGGDANHYKFTSKERDSETCTPACLDYFGGRHHASSLGRFMQVDPKEASAKRIVDPQQWNRYSYTRNSPLIYVDPDGRELKLVIYYDGVKEPVARRAAGLVATNLHAAGVKNVSFELHAGKPDAGTSFEYGALPTPHSHLLEFRSGKDAPNLLGQSINSNYAGQNFTKGNSAVDTTSVQEKTNNDAQLAQGLANEGTHEVSHDAVNPFYHSSSANDFLYEFGAGDSKWLSNANLQFSPAEAQSLQSTFNREGETDTTPPSPSTPPPPTPSNTTQSH